MQQSTRIKISNRTFHSKIHKKKSRRLSYENDNVLLKNADVKNFEKRKRET